ncbi:MAG: hypothetical protein ACLP5H_06965 [Desulfomonilaceae bacterium]
MIQSALTVDQWKELNADKLVECRWRCSMTVEACRSYQSRTSRYVLHFNGQREPYPRVNADYLKCFLPEPCPHLLPDEEINRLAQTSGPHKRLTSPERRAHSRQCREMDRLANPDQMLREAQWNRSLIRL